MLLWIVGIIFVYELVCYMSCLYRFLVNYNVGRVSTIIKCYIILLLFDDSNIITAVIVYIYSVFQIMAVKLTTELLIPS